MGIEMISNVGGTYKEVPRETAPKQETVRTDVNVPTGTQNVVQSETKAINHFNNDGEGQGTGNGWTKKQEKEKEQKVKSVVNSANEKARQLSTTSHCEFKYHEETKRVSITVKDDETGDVIKEIPPEETLNMLSKIWEMAGLFVDDKR